MQIVCIQGKLTANPSPLATILKQICNNKAQSDKLEIVNFAQKIYTMRKTHFEPIQTKNVGLIGVHENLERPHLVPLKLIKDSQPQPYITNSNTIAKYNSKRRINICKKLRRTNKAKLNFGYANNQACS